MRRDRASKAVARLARSLDQALAAAFRADPAAPALAVELNKLEPNDFDEIARHRVLRKQNNARQFETDANAAIQRRTGMSQKKTNRATMAPMTIAIGNIIPEPSAPGGKPCT